MDSMQATVGRSVTGKKLTSFRTSGHGGGNKVWMDLRMHIAQAGNVFQEMMKKRAKEKRGMKATDPERTEWVTMPNTDCFDQINIIRIRFFFFFIYDATDIFPLVIK